MGEKGADLIRKDSAEVKSFLSKLDETLVSMETLVNSYRPLFSGERYLTNEDLGNALHISKRTLQDYRNNGRLAFIKLEGKILYRESDVQKMLDDNYYKAFNPYY
jgi:hypothetical protein